MTACSSDSTSLDALFAPSSICVVGASPKGNRGSAVLENLDRFGYPGKVAVVHPRRDQVFGHDAFPTLEDVPFVPELVVPAVSAEISVDMVEKAAAIGSRGAVLLASGFGEGDGDGRERVRRLSDVIDASGMAVCGPNCYGVADLHRGVAAYSGAIVDDVQPGNVSYLLQSGALSHALHDSAIGRGVGIAKIVTTGNEAGVGLGRYLQYVADDDESDVIVLLVEMIRDVEAFADGARRAAERGKTVIALQLGRSVRGQQTARAHTGAVAGSSVIYRGLFRELGVHQVDDLDELRESAILAAQHSGRSSSAGAAFLSISGGACSLVADLAEELGVPLAAFSPQTTAALEQALPDFAHVENPLDLTGAAARDTTILQSAARILGDADEVGSLTLLFNVGEASPSQRDLYQAHARALSDLDGDIAVPVAAASVVGGAVDPLLVSVLSRHDIPMLSGARPAVRALRVLHEPAPRIRNRPSEAGPSVGGPPVDGSLVSTSGQEALAAVAAAGISVPQSAVVAGPRDAMDAADALGYPVVMKVESSALEHKTEIGGVVTGVSDRATAGEVAAQLIDRARTHGLSGARILIQQQLRGVAEVLVGVVADPHLGRHVVVGAGGVLVELLSDVASAPVPISTASSWRIIDESSAAPLLAGFRGAPPGDIEALADLISRVSELAATEQSIEGIDLNPVIVRPVGEGAVAVDALILRRAPP